MNNTKIINIALIVFLSIFSHGCDAKANISNESPTVSSFISIITGPGPKIGESLSYIEENWEPGFIPMILETIYLSRDNRVNAELVKILEKNTSLNHGYNFDEWYIWLWNEKIKPHPDYALFKSQLYQFIDPKFAKYFSNTRPATIRLDEVRWGGVRQDGIPPLRNPRMIQAKDAQYLADTDVVFGIQINGDTRAYPKRILAWHEMFVDTVGSEPVTGVYCTLCGTVILYKNTLNEKVYNLGTSGFLYRSNKLMYDKDTQSLWNTIWGTPVIGPLVDKDIKLEKLSVVTTTWGEWKKRHPQTTVLSLNTGHRRDYSEGAAYRQYFATDELMFIVPELDTSLKNKDEVLGLIFSHAPDQPLAISSKLLKTKPIYHDSITDQSFVVLTDKSGAHRVYETRNLKFSEWDQNHSLVDDQDQTWKLTEDYLESESGEKLYRLPSHNAFWFGWYSAYKHSRLVK